MNFSNPAYPLLIGFVLDLILGDPRWLPHPIRFFGKLIAFGEHKLNTGNYKKLKGAFMTLVLVLSVYFALHFIVKLTLNFKYLNLALLSVFVFYGLANHSLIKESYWVIRKLKKESVESARLQLSMIVGRDTQNLSENQIRIAVLETLSENLSDGVIAPLFFYFIGGVPLMFAYKMANTLDSMIGYKNTRYYYFGWFAAKFDDVLNFIPARLSTFLMVLITFSFRGLTFIFKYGRKHSSPNAGYPEAALAGILNCKFGGPSFYKGKLVDKPFIGKRDREIQDLDIYKTFLINFLTTLFFIGLFILKTI